MGRRRRDHVVNATAARDQLTLRQQRSGLRRRRNLRPGSWSSTPSTPAAHVTIANSTFVNNRARRDASVSPLAPTEGGAVHAEDQTTLEIYQSRFVTNSADTGGAVSLYRAGVVVADSAFRGNWAAAVRAAPGSVAPFRPCPRRNDPRPTPAPPTAVSANLTVRDSYFEANCRAGRGDAHRRMPLPARRWRTRLREGVPAMGASTRIAQSEPWHARLLPVRCDGGRRRHPHRHCSAGLSDSIVSNSRNRRNGRRLRWRRRVLEHSSSP